MDEQKKKRQTELAKVFYEMGMDDALVAKISGVDLEELRSIKPKKVDKERQKPYNDSVK